MTFLETRATAVLVAGFAISGCSASGTNASRAEGTNRATEVETVPLRSAPRAPVIDWNRTAANSVLKAGARPPPGSSTWRTSTSRSTTRWTPSSAGTALTDRSSPPIREPRWRPRSQRPHTRC